MGVSFTIAEAIARVDAQPEPVWTPGMSSAKKLQRINEVLEALWTFGTWDGLLADVAPTSSGGIITLDIAYRVLDLLTVPSLGGRVPIKNQQWKFGPEAAGVTDWTQYGYLLAFDLGETGSGGARRYQITGNAAYADALTYSGSAKKRYTWATNTATVVVPDCFQAVLTAVRAFHWKDVGDNDRFDREFQNALGILEKSLSAVDAFADYGSMNLAYETSGGAIRNLY